MRAATKVQRNGSVSGSLCSLYLQTFNLWVHFLLDFSLLRDDVRSKRRDTVHQKLVLVSGSGLVGISQKTFLLADTDIRADFDAEKFGLKLVLSPYFVPGFSQRLFALSFKLANQGQSLRREFVYVYSVAFCQSELTSILERCCARSTNTVSVRNLKLIPFGKEVTLFEMKLLFKLLRIASLLFNQLCLLGCGLTPQYYTNKRGAEYGCECCDE